MRDHRKVIQTLLSNPFQDETCFMRIYLKFFAPEEEGKTRWRLRDSSDEGQKRLGKNFWIEICRRRRGTHEFWVSPIKVELRTLSTIFGVQKIVDGEATDRQQESISSHHPEFQGSGSGISERLKIPMTRMSATGYRTRQSDSDASI